MTLSPCSSRLCPPFAILIVSPRGYNQVPHRLKFFQRRDAQSTTNIESDVPASIRDKFVQAFVSAWQHDPGSPDQNDEPVFTPAGRISLLLDGIKLIGTGNGAGAFASVGALYYFASRPELHLPIKAAAIFFIAGLVIFALTVGAFIAGTLATARFVDITDAAKLSDDALKLGVRGMAALIFAVGGAVLSLGCFFIGITIGFCAVIWLA